MVSSSTKSESSESLNGFSLSSWIDTVSRLVPIEEMVSVTDPVAPSAIDTSTIRDATPMMMPSIVRKERILFDAMEFHAIFIDRKIIPSPPGHARQKSQYGVLPEVPRPHRA